MRGTEQQIVEDEAYAIITKLCKYINSKKDVYKKPIYKEIKILIGCYEKEVEE